MTLIKVPFHEKDLAKSLGAKWNPDLKSWFIPDGTSETAFNKWIPSTGSDKAASMKLSELLFKIDNNIKSNFPSQYWVKAEISNISDKNHMYIDLVEYDAHKMESAKIRAVIWNDDRSRILNKFFKNTSEHLSKGISVLLDVSVGFHPRFGLSLNIHDIDPAYTIGAMQAKVNDIILRLTTDKSLHDNRNLHSPVEFLNIAVISPKEAAGLGDFRVEADVLNSAGLCNFHYYSATFQGDLTNDSITKAFKHVESDAKNINFNAIVFIRGGGSKSDLHFVNEFDIAKAIVTSKIPVFTGIGHEQDYAVPDMVANKSFDTPSKVILYIQSIIINNAMNAESNYNNIINNALHDLHLANRTLEAFNSQIRVSSQNAVESSTLSLKVIFDNIRSIIINQANISKEKLTSKRIFIHHYHHSLLEMEKNNIQFVMKSIIQNNPLTVLSRGFAIIKKDTKFISSENDLSINDEIVIKLKDGDISAKVT